jgi:tRNA wybutosine-synthesizing protein 3
MFLRRKNAVLSKTDKSNIGELDSKIKSLCEKINSLPNYYTTSSCSGRIVILVDKDKKCPGVFEAVFHDLINFENFWKYLPKEKAGLDLKFKQEPVIIHVVCETLENAFVLMKKAQFAGFKRNGIISSGKRFVCELTSTEKFEFPLAVNGKIIVDENFLNIVIEKSNENLKKGWMKIERLKKLL